LIGFAKCNGAFDLASRIENANFTGTEALARFRIADCLISLPEHRLNPGTAKTPQFQRRGENKISAG
jgi:hypothetical protein